MDKHRKTIFKKKQRVGDLSKQQQSTLQKLIYETVIAEREREIPKAIANLKETLSHIDSSLTFQKKIFNEFVGEIAAEKNDEQGLQQTNGFCISHDLLESSVPNEGVSHDLPGLSMPNGRVSHDLPGPSMANGRMSHDLPGPSLSMPNGGVSHVCRNDCWVKGTKVDDWSSYGPLEIPLKLGWRRVVTRTNCPDVYYVSPCGKKMECMEDIQLYLQKTCVTDVHISQFTFDHLCSLETHVFNQAYCVEDISYGKEKRPISCANSVNDSRPDEFEYTTVRTYEPDVRLDCDSNSMVCCSCTDNCRIRSKCECWQLTLEEAQTVGSKHSVGYVHGRLRRHQYSAIYECHPRCKCGPQCVNRVVQRGVSHRLQVFHSVIEQLKWGVRTLDDIPQGSFVCTYLGHIYTERGSDETAVQNGDAYFAELDYIEVIQQEKEGYESDVISVGSCSPLDSQESNSSSTNSNRSLLSSVVSEMDLSLGSSLNSSRLNSLSNCVSDNENSESTLDAFEIDEQVDINHGEAVRSALSACQQGDHCFKAPTNTQSRNCIPTSPLPVRPLTKTNRALPLTTPPPPTRASPLTTPPPYSHLSTPSSPTSSTKLSQIKANGRRIRQFFKDDGCCYIMDAKSVGNIGRFINHSCSPNLFVQNVFIDTHDCRFPWVALFAKRHIKAFEELTWDYNYEVGSVPGRSIECQCGSHDCRGRLL